MISVARRCLVNNKNTKEKEKSKEKVSKGK